MLFTLLAAMWGLHMRLNHKFGNAFYEVMKCLASSYTNINYYVLTLIQILNKVRINLQ
jgi:hypothetical protein